MAMIRKCKSCGKPYDADWAEYPDCDCPSLRGD